jgi:hypothetical protein
MHGDGDVLAAAGRLPEHRRMSAFWIKRIINAPEQLRNIAEEIVLLHEIGHCASTSDKEIVAWAWARAHATRRSKQFMDEMASRALSTYERPGRENKSVQWQCYVEYCLAAHSVPRERILNLLD